jgi:hypothetical protein
VHVLVARRGPGLCCCATATPATSTVANTAALTIRFMGSSVRVRSEVMVSRLEEAGQACLAVSLAIAEALRVRRGSGGPER